MTAGLLYEWSAGGRTHALRMAPVDGTAGNPFSFGAPPRTKPVDLEGFHIATTPTTQALWEHVMGTNPALHRDPLLPLENVSWDELAYPDGFLDRINRGPIRSAFSPDGSLRFRLPTETEWEYAARGGPHWRDGFPFSGSERVDDVAWYDRRHGDHTQPVALKAANQLGLFDMSGNVWEWCEDVHTPAVEDIPSDGSAYGGAGSERVLRGGCFHNWAVHCTVWKRYEIGAEFHDGCIGFRLVLGR